MKLNQILKTTAAATLAAGMMFAQSAPPAAGDEAPRHQFGMRQSLKDLNLTPDQKQQAKSIFSEARQSAQPLGQQLRQAHQDMTAAVKANAGDAQIDKIAQSIGSLTGQMSAIRNKAAAKFYAILTPDQKTQLGDRLPFRPAFGPGRHARPQQKLN